jgi:hypothetical protein
VIDLIGDVRVFTNKLLEMCDNIGEYQWALEMALTYMSEDEVKDMCEMNCVFEHEEEENEDDDN